MKIGERLKGNPAWEALGEVVMEAITAGEKAKDGGVYIVGLRLLKIIKDVGNIEIDAQPAQETQGMDRFQDLFKKVP